MFNSFLCMSKLLLHSWNNEWHSSTTHLVFVSNLPSSGLHVVLSRPSVTEGLNHNSVFTSPLHDFRHSLHLLLSYQRPTAYFISIWRSCSTCLTTSLAFTTTEFWADGFGELRYSFWVIRASSKATTVYIRLTPLYTSNYWIVPDILSASQSVSPYSSAILSSIYFF